MKLGHNSIDEKKLAELIATVEEIDGKIFDLNQEKKNAYADAKAAGLDVSTLRELINERRRERQNPDKYMQRLTLLEAYRQTLQRMKIGV